MSNFGVISLIFISTAFSSIADSQLYCFDRAGKGEKVKEIKPLPDKYKVNIAFVNQLKNFSADIIEYYSKDESLTAMKCNREKQSFDCIYNRSSNVLSFVNKTSTNNISCQTSLMNEKMAKDNDSSSFFPDFIKTPKPIMGLIDLFHMFKNSANLSIDNLHMNETHDHGLPIVHYIGCDKTKDDQYWVEFLVCMTKPNDFSFAGGEKVSEVPTRIELKVYDSKNASTAIVRFNAVYELFAYKTDFDEHEDEYYRLPPPGVHCDGMNNSKDLPELPKNFSVLIDYIDINNKRIDGSEIFYDSEKHISAFEFFHAHKDEAISKGLKDATVGHNRVVHDFNTGVQYVLNGLSGHCINVSAIPTEVGDVVMTNRKAYLKNEFELLFTVDPKKFVYVGQRYESNIPLDVWTASVTDGKTEKIVYEVYFSVEKWTLEDGYVKSANNLPVFFKVYHQDNTDTKVTVQHFHDLTVYGDKNGLFWPKLDVFPCMNVTAQSYFMIQINGTMKNLRDIGIHVVTSHIKQELANLANNISVLRVGHVNFIEDKNAVNVSFGIAEKYSGPTTTTNYSFTEVDASVAIANINKSLMVDNHKFTVSWLNDQILNLAMLKGSFVSSRYYPPDTKPVVQRLKGYTGGSMAAMGIFMLLIGGVGGVVLAFVYLKRHRGGIAYQIYE